VLTGWVRQPEKKQLGAQGEAAVTLAFAALGWGVATAPDHDIGTDLFLLARDSRLFDVGLVVGAQVRTGGSFFDEPVLAESGSVTGWWFRQSDRKHVDYWLAHVLPHLIVLHDPTDGTSYWAQITAKSVVSTGKGAKVFVPRENTIDEEHRKALLAVAATLRPPAAWEGSAWTGAGDLAPADLLRHALLVPRLVAPHRNAGFGRPVGAEQVVALLVEGRPDEVEWLASEHPQIPTLTEAADSPDWMWRFVGAFGARVTTGASDQLRSFIEDAPNPPARAAATVVAAAALLEQARPDEAIVLLRATLDRDDNTSVDHAWLLLQHARACLEVGRIDEARSGALQVQQVRQSHAGDVTATAIAGSAALLLFTASDWDSKDVQEAVTGLDTTAVWWRSQRVASGSNAVIEREFTTWTRREVVVIAAEDTANNRLFTAALLASHLGDHSGWCTLDSLNAKQALLRVGRASEPDQVRELLAALRATGDDKSLDLAVQRLVADGPAAAVTAAAAEIDLTHWTHTTDRTNLTLLRRGGDVLDEITASTAVAWLLAALVDPATFLTRTRPTSDFRLQFVETLAGVVPAAPPGDRPAVLEFVLALEAQQDQVVATSWARVVQALPAGIWTRHLASRATRAAGAHHNALRLALLAAAAPADDGAQRQLLSEIRDDNSLAALAAFGNVSGLPEDVVCALVAVVESLITRKINEATRGAYGFGSHDAGRTLAVLNLAYPDLARWEPIYALLEEPLVAGRDKGGACAVLARRADQLGLDVQARLAEIASAAVNHPPTPVDQLYGRPGVLGPAAELAASLGSDVEATQILLARQLTGDTDQRAWASRLALHLAPSVAAGVLTPLAQDPEPTIRATAASCLAVLIADDTGDTLAAAALRQCVKDPGTLVPRRIAETLTSQPAQTITAGDILQQLASHRSASVRAAAAERPRPPSVRS
jgi:hypothetical protein